MLCTMSTLLWIMCKTIKQLLQSTEVTQMHTQHKSLGLYRNEICWNFGYLRRESETHGTLSAEHALWFVWYTLLSFFFHEAQGQCTHTQNEKHKTLNSPCAHKGVSNKTFRTVRQATEQENGSHDISARRHWLHCPFNYQSEGKTI